MIFELTVREVTTSDGKGKFFAYATLKKENGADKWYNVKFVKDCAPPKRVKVADGVIRAYMELTADSKYDISPKFGGTVYVEEYKAVEGDALKKAVAATRKRVEDYRKAREAAKRNFIAADDDAPEEFDAPPPDDDDIM